MSTRRERLEARLQRRREWAEGRRAKAAERFSQADPYRGDVAFNTQPGHIPERARVIRATEKGCEHYGMARHHEAKADGLERQLAHTIFSDDEDATERIAEKVAALQEQREQMKRTNEAWRKAKKPAPDDSEGWRKVADLLGRADNDFHALRRDMAARFHYQPQPFPSWALTNLGANIRRLEGRTKEVERRQERSAAAEASGGVSVEGGDYVAVTFAEKPERDTINELKAAGFRWSGGSWCGYREKIPASVAELAGLA